MDPSFSFLHGIFVHNGTYAYGILYAWLTQHMDDEAWSQILPGNKPDWGRPIK